jgi:DNA-binding NarL/FixJ family response regulator
VKAVSTKRAPARARNAKRRKAASRKTGEVLDLVRAEVERFILKDAPIGEFQRAVRTAAKKGELSHHPLTAAVFRRIVKQAIQEQKRRSKVAVSP